MKSPLEMNLEELAAFTTAQVLAMPREWQEEWLIQVSGYDGPPTNCSFSAVWDSLYPDCPDFTE